MSNRTINFTVHKLKSFKKVLSAAEQKQQDTFKFEGNEYLVSYAKYLVEYLGPRLGA